MLFSYDRTCFCLLLTGALATPAHAAPQQTFTYTALGQIASVDGPRTDVTDITRYAYDAQGNLTSVTNALGQLYRMTHFTPFGNPQTLTDPNGVITQLTYTPQGWLASSSTGTAVIRYTYSNTGDITQISMGDGNWIKYRHDNARRVVGITNRLGESVDYTLDAQGNRTRIQIKSSTGEAVNTQQYVYDELGRLLRSLGAAGQTHQFGHDLNDNLVSATSPRNHKTQHSFDALNRLVQSVDPLGAITRINYDPNDRPTQVMDARQVTTRYEYDEHGNLTRSISPDRGTTLYTYDNASNVIKRVDARGVITQYAYDALNRLVSRSYPATPGLNTRFIYDESTGGNPGIGRLTSIQDSTGTLRYTYDAVGNLTHQSRSLSSIGAAVTDSVGYAYDAGNHLQRVDYPTALSVAYTRNVAAQVTDVTLTLNGSVLPLATSISYQPFGPLKSLAWANGLLLTRAYDADYRLATQTLGTWQTRYGFDASSNITSISSSLWGAVQYQYDAAERLTQEQTSALRKAYVLDPVANRTRRTTTLASGAVSEQQTLGYATTSNRLTSLDGQAVEHDAMGNQTRGSNRRHTYDDQGRLSEVYQASVQKVADYRYNALGQRIVKRSFDPATQALIETTLYLYAQNGQLLGQTVFNRAGVKTTGQYWIWLDQMPLAQVNMAFAANGSVTGSTLLYLHADHLNTPRLATDSSRTLRWSWNSDAYGLGSPNEDVDGDGQRVEVALRFPGQLFDAQSQLNYNYFRDYNPQTGRYVESDPIGLADSPNTFGYALGNPLVFSDNYGLSTGVFDLPLPLILPEIIVPSISSAAAAMGSGLACLMYAEPLANGECPSGGCYYATDKTNKPKAKAANSDPNDIIRTPTTHPDDFSSISHGDKKNVNTGEIWSPSNTNHSGSEGGEWKVGPKPGIHPTSGAKITVSAGGKIIKINK